MSRLTFHPSCANHARMDLKKRAAQNIAERLTWCTASRDQAGIAQDLADGKDISEVYGLGEAGLFDEFFYFLEQFGFMELFMKLHPVKNKRTSNVKFPTVVLDHWDVAGIESLTTAGFYGELGSGPHENKKDFVANPLHAVVVLHDPYKQKHPDSDPLVILTNGPVTNPLSVYDGYDARSEIENGLFREAKQAWFIERPARNTAAAFRSHVYLTLITMALTNAFRTWMDQQDKLEQQGQETGIRKFREKVRQENGNKLIVFDEDRYAIFDTYEVFILCGRNVRKPTGVPQVVSKQDIPKKYGARLE